ncbi:MAG TPA: hypothetical protein DD791_10860 [Syntrophomonas sp.]|jgi:transcriptional regulator with XRE-family HTH domain|nr:hypothetical protein [Syntrophomonas sp.]
MITRIRDLMKKHNVNATTLTAETGLAKSAISDWKAGRSKPSTDAVLKITEFFGVSTDYILLGKECDNNLSELELELLELFRQLSTDRQKERFLGKAELLIKDMTETELDHKIKSS